MPVLSALKWPNVPACYGWLSLDRRGQWRLKGQVIRHSGLISAINGHYGADASGNWIFENGPQVVYVSLDYTPFVYRIGNDYLLTAHTGALAGPANAVFLDNEGNVLLNSSRGIGLLDDRDLPIFMEHCLTEAGEEAQENDILGVVTDEVTVYWGGIKLQSINRSDVSQRFGFKPGVYAAPIL